MKSSLTSIVKRGLVLVSLLLILCSSSLLFQFKMSIVHAEPAYAKWGVIAVKEAQSKYGVSVKDYAHIGRTVISDSVAEEKFRLLMKKDNQEFTVQVTVRFNPLTDALSSVDFTVIN